MHAAAIQVVRPSRGWSALRLREVWEHRELLYFLVWRDLKVRYRQTALGVAWILLQPLLSAALFTIVFGRVAGIPSEGAPYDVFVLAGLVPWIFFSGAVARAATSLVAHANVLTKVYFPRLIVPIASVGGGIVDMLVATLLLVVVAGVRGVGIGPPLAALPLLFLLAVLCAIGVSLWLSALNVQYRDVGAVIPFLTQLWMFATPIVYPANLLPERWQALYRLNPMVGVIEGFRWAVLGTSPAPWASLAVSAAVVVALCVSGAFYFRRVERAFADVV
jgi:lipopolysaccharide transport system permease protein